MNTNVEDVFFEVGDALPRRDFGARKPTRVEVVEKGRKWLEERKLEICQIISSASIMAVLKGSTPEEEQMRVVADLIAAHAIGIPPFVLARAVVILGAHWFC